MKREEYAQRCNEVHDNKYSYELLPENVVSSNRIKVICPDHGAWKPIASNHLYYKTGCPHCAHVERSHRMRWTPEHFEKLAKEVHGDKYSYDLTTFHSASSKVKAICSVHGPFWTSPANHIHHKTNCPKCSAPLKGQKNVKTTEQYVAECKQVHGETYDYTQTKYIRASLPVTVICKKHGAFTLMAKNHLHQGTGCRQCWIDRMAGHGVRSRKA